MNSGSDVSVVVQGPVSGRPDDPPERQLTRRVLAQVRQLWPAAEIILSTWRGAVTEGLDFNELVTSDDPGAIPLNDHALQRTNNNLNRQIVSTRHGLARATRPYAVKLRTDCLLQRAIDFGELNHGPRHPKWSIFEKPVLTLNLHTVHPLRRPVLFFISDIFHAGLRSDLLSLWSIPLVEEPGFTRAIDPQHRPLVNAFPEGDYLMRCAPEQYVGEQLSRHLAPDLHLQHFSDGSPAQLFLWLRVLSSNFRLFTFDELALTPPAHIAANMRSFDLFQPADRAWLEKWTRPSVPTGARAFAALRFRLLQLAYRSRPQPRPRWRRALGALVRTTT